MLATSDGLTIPVQITNNFYEELKLIATASVAAEAR